MIIAHNMMAINAQNQFNKAEKSKKKSAERLGSGYRINRAADDAAGLSISEKMRGQIRGLDQGARNIQDGISLLQVADGALNEVHDILHRMTELSIQAANDTNTIDDRTAIQEEINQLNDEISRIGSATTFNNLHILDDAFGLESEGKITNLVTSDAAQTGYLTDAIKVGSYYFPSATIDFSNINAKNISKLNDQGFSFCCSRGCEEVFDISFVTDGRPSSATNLNGKVHHNYVVDISDCKSGQEVVTKIYDYVKANLPINNMAENSNVLPGALGVSHSNNMIIAGDGSALTIYANRRITNLGSFVLDGYATAEEAEKVYPSSISGINSWAGAIDCTSLTSVVSDEFVNEFVIQCGANQGESVTITTPRINADTLGVSSISVMSNTQANDSIGLTQKAVEKVSKYRSQMGAWQNRLEHSYDNVKNESENLQSAESYIRDADMADEIVDFSKQSILEQVGQSMISQASQSSEGILNLLK